MEYPEIDSTGELVCLRTGSDPERLAQSVAAGNSLLSTPAPDAPSWWDGTSWRAKPARPSSAHEWDIGAKFWRDSRSLQDARISRNGAMKAAMDSASSAQITVAGLTYDADPAAMAAMLQEVQLASLTPTAAINWTLANNVVRSHTLAQLRTVAQAIRTRNTANRAKYEARRAAISAALSIAAVDAVAW
jgi:Domain of unknown function (DUF4376)